MGRRVRGANECRYTPISLRARSRKCPMRRFAGYLCKLPRCFFGAEGFGAMLTLLACSSAFSTRAILTALPSTRTPLLMKVATDQAYESLTSSLAAGRLTGKVVPTQMPGSKPAERSSGEAAAAQGADSLPDLARQRFNVYPYLLRITEKTFVYGQERDSLAKTLQCLMIVGDGNDGYELLVPKGSQGMMAKDFLAGDRTPLGNSHGCSFVVTDTRVPTGGSIGADGIILDARGEAVLGADGTPMRVEKHAPSGNGLTSMANAFTLGDRTPLGNSIGCGVVVPFAGERIVAVRAFPYLLRRTSSDFLYGEQEALGQMLACELSPSDIESPHVRMAISAIHPDQRPE